MPTGTGKTETMLALLVAAPLVRLLVVVPNDNLRSQISAKFMELGVLRACGCLGDRARLPAVAVLRHRPKTVEDVDDIFLRANVVVSTMQIVGGCPPEIQERMAENVSALFVDEAHHIGARTWNAFKEQFVGRRRVVQFTATPFRNDGRRVDGKFIYVYPLKKALEEQYFKKSDFLPVNGLDQSGPRYWATTASIFRMASTQPLEAVDLFADRHATTRPWPGGVFPHTPVISALHAITESFRASAAVCTFDAVSPSSKSHLALILSSWACMQ
jgi:superfamily II DNA or RNA helicase